MEPTIGPGLPEQLPEHFQLFLYIGYAIITALVLAIGFLWRHILKKETDLEKLNEYVRNQDKDNVQILNNLANLLSNIESNLGKIPDETANKIHISINDLLLRIEKRANS